MATQAVGEPEPADDNRHAAVTSVDAAEHSSSGGEDEKEATQGGWVYIPKHGWVQTQAKSAEELKWADLGKKYSEVASHNDPMHQKVRQYATQVMYMAQKPKWGRSKRDKERKRGRRRTREPPESRTLRMVGVVRASSVPAPEDRRKAVKQYRDQAGQAAAAGIAAGMAVAAGDAVEVPSPAAVEAMSEAQLKDLAAKLELDVSDCVGKEQLLQRLEESRPGPITRRGSDMSSLKHVSSSSSSRRPRTKEELLRLRKRLERKRRVQRTRDADGVGMLRQKYTPDVTVMHMGNV